MTAAERIMELCERFNVEFDEVEPYNDTITLNFICLYRMIEQTGMSRAKSRRVLAVAVMANIEGLVQAIEAGKFREQGDERDETHAGTVRQRMKPCPPETNPRRYAGK